MTAADATGTRGLDGRTALVWGAGGGHGKAIAEAFARAGALVVCADPSLEAAQITAEAVVSTGGAATARPADMTQQGLAEQAVAEISDSCGRVDILCNCGERPGDGELVEEIDDGEFDQVFRQNFKAALFCSQAVGRRMIEHGGGSITTVTSAVLDKPLRGSGSYVVAAAAVAYFTKVFAKEAGARNVRANVIAVAPDSFSSPFDSSARAEDLETSLKTTTALERAVSPDDLAALALFLAGDGSSFITGQTIRLSGGWTMPW